MFSAGIGIHQVLDSMPPLWSAMTLCAGGHVTGARGVTACVTPSMPDRSLPNSVLYEDPDELIPQLGALTAHYAHHGVRAWTVWVHPGHEALASILARRGHVLDADPAAMVHTDLDRLGPPPPLPDGLRLDPEGDGAALGALNDDAYGLPPDRAMAPLVASMDGALAIHVLRDAVGRPLAGAAVFDREEDGELTFVATARSARGRGLGGLVCRHALHDARERGMRRSTLQATKLGEPVYRRLGYEAVGNLQMWELRASAVS